MNINVYGDVYVEYSETQTERKVENKQEIRKNVSFKTAKKNVRKRDKVCQVCGDADSQLQVHHIMSLAKYPELASDESNMILLCSSCHSKYHDRYNGSEGADTFCKWLIDGRF